MSRMRHWPVQPTVPYMSNLEAELRARLIEAQDAAAMWKANYQALLNERAKEQSR